MDKHKFKLKGTGPTTYHLGCDFFRNKDGVMCMAPNKYIDKMVSTYEQMFGCKPSTKVSSPLEKGDHPEIDTSDILDKKGIQQYQQPLIGAMMQWAVSIGRINITTAVMTLSGFRTAPGIGHLDRARRTDTFTRWLKYAMIRVRTEEPNYSDLVPEQDFAWAYSVYGNVREVELTDAPELTRKTEELDHERLLVTVILVLSQTVIGYLYIWRLWLGTLVVQSYGHRSLYLY
jgi:hypothetical protein